MEERDDRAEHSDILPSQTLRPGRHSDATQKTLLMDSLQLNSEFDLPPIPDVRNNTLVATDSTTFQQKENLTLSCSVPMDVANAVDLTSVAQ